MCLDCFNYRVFIKYCFFSKILIYIPDSGLSWFPLGVSVCTQWQVKHQHCSRTGRVKKNHNILRKNTIFNEHPVAFKGRLLISTLSISCHFQIDSISLTDLFPHTLYLPRIYTITIYLNSYKHRRHIDISPSLDFVLDTTKNANFVVVYCNIRCFKFTGVYQIN